MRIAVIFLVCHMALSGLWAQTKPLAPFAASEMLLQSPTGSLSGTLTVPAGNGPFKVVLIIAGSGPTDRDGNSTAGVQTNAYRMLSEGFAAKGIASLRYDKRGIAASRSAMISESEIRFETYISDAVSWIARLQNDKRFSDVVVLGHSEGSLIGMVAALQTTAAKFISVSGVGRPADKLIQEQLKGKLEPRLLNEAYKTLASLKAGMQVQQVDPALVSLFRPSVQPYMISWMKYDPTKEIARLKIPVCIVQGTTDMQVTIQDAKWLAEAKPGAQLILMEKMNHVLKESEADVQQNSATYRDPVLPLKAGLIDTLARFISASR